MIFFRSSSPIRFSFLRGFSSGVLNVTLSPQKSGRAGVRLVVMFHSAFATRPAFAKNPFFIGLSPYRLQGPGQTKINHLAWVCWHRHRAGARAALQRCPVLRSGVWYCNCWYLSVKRKLLKKNIGASRFRLQKRERVVKLSLLRWVKIAPVGGNFHPPPSPLPYHEKPPLSSKKGV